MGSREPLINKLTSYWSGKYMHCEIVFNDGSGRNLACGVWQNETVFLRHKTFGKDCWVWRSVRMSPSDIRKMKAFCKQQADNNIPFNKSGLFRCTTPFPRPTDGKQWFCSELCMVALQTVGLFPEEMPSAITPTRLHELLGRLDTYANASPLTEQRIASKTLKFGFTKNKKKRRGGRFLSYK
jgi:hypothetical protein